MKEFIVCSANWYNDGKEYVHSPNNIILGFVTCGLRHHNCISTFAQIVGFPYSAEAQELHNTEVEGFLTNKNNFVNRKDAFDIAVKSGQMIDRDYKRELHSEDLY